MEIKILTVAFFFAAICCASRTQDGLFECSEFEFKNLNKDSNKWKEELPFKKVSDAFFKENINQIRELKYDDPSSFYKVCDLSSNNLEGYVIAKANGPILNMYFISQSSDKVFMLACEEASSDEYLMKKSKLVGINKLEMTTIRVSEEEGFSTKDSIVSYYSVEKPNVLRKIKSDSVRSTIAKK